MEYYRVKQQGYRTEAARAQRNLQNRIKRRKRAVRRQLIGWIALTLSILAIVRGGVGLAGYLDGLYDGVTDEIRRISEDSSADAYEEELAELLKLNEEAADYVKCYPERETYKSQAIDLGQELLSGEVPLLMQWDKRWGYDFYGDEMIGLAGCGPLCLDMAYLYFTKDSSMTPREMAAFVQANGYRQEGVGTKWTLWTEGVEKLGLSGGELPLDQGAMERVLDAGGLVVCSMGPGDFTSTGHFILIRGYDENGFYVNDPNRKSNSERQWDFDALSSQIRNLWSLYE